MAGRLAEIIASGRPPGVAGQHADPGGPDAAIPRALKELEKTQSAREIARAAGFTVETLKKTWKV